MSTRSGERQHHIAMSAVIKYVQLWWSWWWWTLYCEHVTLQLSLALATSSISLQSEWAGHFQSPSFSLFSVWCHLWSLHFLSPSQFDIYSLFLRHTLQVTCTEIKSENEPICVAETTAEAETWGADQLLLHFAPSQTGVYSFQKIINAVSKEVKMCFNSCTSTSILIRGYIK